MFDLAFSLASQSFLDLIFDVGTGVSTAVWAQPWLFWLCIFALAARWLMAYPLNLNLSFRCLPITRHVTRTDTGPPGVNDGPVAGGDTCWLVALGLRQLSPAQLNSAARFSSVRFSSVRRTDSTIALARPTPDVKEKIGIFR